MARAAMMAAGRNRLVLGSDLRLLDAALGQLWLEGSVRLRPGQPVELVGHWPGIEPGLVKARVITWRVVRLTREGPYYRGSCRLDA